MSRTSANESSANKLRRRVWRELELVEDAVIVDDYQQIPGELRSCPDCNEPAGRA